MALFLSVSLGACHVLAQAKEEKLYLVGDEGHHEWCAYRSQSSWKSDVDKLSPARVGTLIYTVDDLSAIEVSEQDETGDWIVYDEYSLASNGELRGDQRRINILPGDRAVEETYEIHDGKAEKQSSTTRSLSTGKASATSETWLPGVPITTRVENFPFAALIKQRYSTLPSEAKVCATPLHSLGAILAAGNAQATPCSPHPSVPVQVHWSETYELQSPDCRWHIEIRPAEGGDGPARAYIRSRSGEASRLLFELDRDGIIHWGTDGDSLLLEDMRFSDHYFLLVFSPLTAPQSEEGAQQIDKEIRADVERKLKPNENIAYYLPRYVAWTEGGLAVSVGVVTVKGQSGPFTDHCFGYEVATETSKLKVTLTEDDLKKRYHASCQKWP